ncbi:hypothetical protein B0H17DRAFT_1210456 [Mycena rosella]|uniref:Uncharacterized protein n=1 Tax=Mycena rosella TaxID=1033263 RepID=A0AAD7CW24_MYCRO|nr:hypothetical protein B0H17DRAFT_1210456 [Mycena rosella]
MGVLCTFDTPEQWSQSGQTGGAVDFIPESTCGFCTYRPYIPLPQAPLLYELLTRDPSAGQYGDVLQTLGVIHDTHLRILMGMHKEDRESLLERYVPSRLTQFGCIELTQLLHEFAETHVWAPLTLKTIARKGETFEGFLSRPSTCGKLSARSMRLSQAEYDVLSAQIKLQVTYFLDIDRAFEKQDPAQVQALVNAMRDDYPFVKRYEQAWPIYVIVKRLLATPGTFDRVIEASMQTTDCSFEYTKSQCQSRRSQHLPPIALAPIRILTASTPAPRQHICPRLAQYLNSAGPEHAYVSPTARDLLSSLQMDEELCPVLFHLGVHDDVKFDAVKRMKAHRKAQLIGQNDLELTAVQRVVLYMIFDG